MSEKAIESVRKRTNCECIVELSIEMNALNENMQKLKKAILADPESIPASAKALWNSQYKAMNDYKTALKARIIDLIENDKD